MTFGLTEVRKHGLWLRDHCPETYGPESRELGEAILAGLEIIEEYGTVKRWLIAHDVHLYGPTALADGRCIPECPTCESYEAPDPSPASAQATSAPPGEGSSCSDSGGGTT